MDDQGVLGSSPNKATVPKLLHAGSKRSSMALRPAMLHSSCARAETLHERKSKHRRLGICNDAAVTLVSESKADDSRAETQHREEMISKYDMTRHLSAHPVQDSGQSSDSPQEQPESSRVQQAHAELTAACSVCLSVCDDQQGQKETNPFPFSILQAQADRHSTAVPAWHFSASMPLWPLSASATPPPLEPSSDPFDPPSDPMQSPPNPCESPVTIKLEGSPSPSSDTSLDSPQSLLGQHVVRPLQLQQLHRCDSVQSAAVLRHQHQLHMIDLMLARVTAAEEAMQQGILLDALPISYLANAFGPFKEAKGCPVDQSVSALNAPLAPCHERQESSGPCQIQTPFDSMASDASGDPLDSVGRQFSEASVQEHVGCLDVGSTSLIDSPGSCLIPRDWLTDDNDEAELACPMAMFSGGKQVHTLLPLMPPSLGICATYSSAVAL